MLKSYNELSRWYSALEPETEAVGPARGDTAEPVAGEDDGIDRHPGPTGRDDSAPEPAEPGAPDTPIDLPDNDRAVDNDSVVEKITLEKAEPVDADERGGLLAVDDRDGIPVADERGGLLVVDERDGIPVTDDHGGLSDADDHRSPLVADDHRGLADERDGFPVADEPRRRAEAPEPAPAPLAELAARRSEFTGGWSDWVAEPAPGPDDEYDAELVQFPWSEDAADHYDEPRVLEPSGALRASRARRCSWVVLGVSVLVLVLAATGVFFLLFGRDSGENAKHAAALQFTAGNLAADPVDPCPTERGETVLRSAEPGGTGSGPDAVLAFQYAYYVTRSGEQARAVVAPDAQVSPAAVIQRGIDSIPVGTTHCVRITTVGADRYTVEVTEFRPAGAPATYTKQSVRTAVLGDRTYITGIAAG